MRAYQAKTMVARTHTHKISLADLYLFARSYFKGFAKIKRQKNKKNKNTKK
jgi:hypothetical protein